MNTHRSTAPAREPAITVGTVSALVSAVLALLVVLGLSLPDGFEAAILAVLAAAAPIIAGIITRAKVTPTQDVVERVEGGRVLAGPANDLVAEGDDVRAHDA